MKGNEGETFLAGGEKVKNMGREREKGGRGRDQSKGNPQDPLSVGESKRDAYGS